MTDVCNLACDQCLNNDWQKCILKTSSVFILNWEVKYWKSMASEASETSFVKWNHLSCLADKTTCEVTMACIRSYFWYFKRCSCDSIINHKYPVTLLKKIGITHSVGRLNGHQREKWSEQGMGCFASEQIVFRCNRVWRWVCNLGKDVIYLF